MKKISAIQKIPNYFFMMINVKTLELLVLVVDIDAKVTILGINPDAMLIIAKLDIILTECKIIVLKIVRLKTKKAFIFMRIILIKYLIFKWIQDIISFFLFTGKKLYFNKRL